MKVAIVCRLLMVLALLALLVAGPVTGTVAKGKATCKGGKVPVTVGKRTTCQPVAKAFPKPQSVDLRLAYLQKALTFDVAKAHTRKAKRARTLQSGFGAAGRSIRHDRCTSFNPPG